MPILAKETCLFPDNLLALAQADLESQHTDTQIDADEVYEIPRWWAIYTRSRQEKQLMRKLHSMETPFCCPTIERRHRSPAGRMRTVYEPLFSNYVFAYGDAAARYNVLTTNCVSRCEAVKDGLRLTHDLAQIHRLIDIGKELGLESKLVPGERVRVKNGAFAGFEGTVIQRQNERRLLVAVEFMQQGASVLLDDCQLESLGTPPAVQDKGSIDVVYNLRKVKQRVTLG
jgi:transcriptional antiterminator RfaH